jgi:hypothetical protein
MEAKSMPITPIVRYYSRWSVVNHDGRLALYDANNLIVDNRTYTNPDEFRLIMDVLRNEKPLWFDTDTGHLSTGYGAAAEPVGEEEGI